jgi:ABC-type uncharacterized transport system substrate-binding protein
MNRFFIRLAFFILIAGQVLGKDVTYLQFFYMIKNIFPETKEVAIFLPKDIQEQEQSKIASASVKMGLTIKLYLISDMSSIRSNLKLLPAKSVLLVYTDPLLMEKSNRDHIINSCAEKQIPIISSSQEYITAGALIGLLIDESNKLKVVINVQQYPQIASLFSEEFTQKIGAAEVIR